jgi:hypothetical protein
LHLGCPFAQELRLPLNELNLGYDISFAVFVRNRKLGSARLNIVDVKAELRNGMLYVMWGATLHRLDRDSSECWQWWANVMR